MLFRSWRILEMLLLCPQAGLLLLRKEPRGDESFFLPILRFIAIYLPVRHELSVSRGQGSDADTASEGEYSN